MSFDPAADPWGTAMLGAAGLWAISALIVVGATVKGSSRQTGGRVMLVSLLGFLGAAGGGTWVRIQAGGGSASTTEGTPTAPSAEDGSGAAGSSAAGGGDEASSGDTGGSPDVGSGTGEASGTTGSDEAAETDEPTATGDTGGTYDGSTGDAADETATDTPDEEPPEPTAAVGSKVPVIPPLPSEIEARDKEIRARLREADMVASSNRSCATLDQVALAWAKLRTLPADGPGYRRARRVADELEECRRKLLYSISRRHRRVQVDARDAFAKEIGRRFEKEHGLRVAVTISGMSHEKLRIGGTGLDATKADALMDGGLRGEVEALAFAYVVLSDTKVAKTYEFEVTPDNLLGLPDMREVGLGERLELPRS